MSLSPRCHPDRRHASHGLCKSCYNAIYHSTHIAERRARDSTPERLAGRAVWRATHKKETAAACAKWYAGHKAQQAAYDAARKPAYHAARLKNDFGFRLKCALRTRLYCAIRNGQKAGSAVRDLGCSIQHLKLHLALFWDEGMTWKNWGVRSGQWSIDHIKPLTMFNLSDPIQALEANHYLNLQPLWHADNVRKGARVV